jgi:protein-S-isoprenylcysteine O-methyltransferase Ste14
MMTGILGRSMALAAIYFERYGLPLLFFFYAGEHCYWILTPGSSEYRLIQAYPLVEIFRQVVWILFDILIALMLLLGRRVTVLPKNVKDLVVPLATTFFFLAYEASDWFPKAVKENLCPVGSRGTCITIGLLLNLAGLIISIWALLSLGRSFGVFIEVRKVVVEGAYRWMRHPIYFGELFYVSGFMASNFSVAYFVLVPLHIALIVYRARLEEARLAESSPEYQEYQKRTGFIFPRFGR